MEKDLKLLNIRFFDLDWHTDRHMTRISKILKASLGWNIASDWNLVDFWTHGKSRAESKMQWNNVVCFQTNEHICKTR